MKTNIYHKYHSFAANITNITVWQLCSSLKGYGGLGGEHFIVSGNTRRLHPGLQNHRKPVKTMQRHINVPHVREGSAAERKPVNIRRLPPVTSACLKRILSISINLWKRGGLPPPSPSGSRRTLSPGPPSTIISYYIDHLRILQLLLYVLADIQYCAKKKLPEIDFVPLKQRSKTFFFTLGPS